VTDESAPRVLVVDDDPPLRDLLCEVLAAQGCEARCVGDGRAALELLLAGTWLPDVILLDLVMPIMDGWAFRAVQRAHDALPPIPVIVISTVDGLRRQAEALDAIALVPKPFDIDELLATVRAALGPPPA
jgi:two-component system, chemotaxis family, chemotaxis protein CheY